MTLEDLIPSALAVLQETMNVPLEINDPNFARVLSAKKDAAGIVMNTAIKADENRFRQKKTDILDALMARIAAADKPVVIDAPVVVSA